MLLQKAILPDERPQNESGAMRFYLALATAIAIGIFGQISLKTGALKSGNLFEPRIIIGLGSYFLSAMFYIYALKKIPLSQAYPTVAVSYGIVAYLSHILWGDPFGFRQIIAISFIGIGIGLLNS